MKPVFLRISSTKNVILLLNLFLVALPLESFQRLSAVALLSLTLLLKDLDGLIEGLDGCAFHLQLLWKRRTDCDLFYIILSSAIDIAVWMHTILLQYLGNLNGSLCCTCEVRVYSSYRESYSRLFSWYCSWYTFSCSPTSSILFSFTSWAVQNADKSKKIQLWLIKQWNKGCL